jgi:NhaA family Na+:H+ antiporter
MIVPALAYLAITAGGDGTAGWGIPMATDIAFALGVVALLGPRVPPALKVFLLTLAIVDDIGAIVVIAVVYSGPLAWGWLAGAAAVVAAVVGCRALRVRYPVVYVALGAVLWLCVFESGVHATIAGVVMGLLTPARSQGTPPTERLVQLLHPWTSFLVVPLFAFTSAGIELTARSVTSPGAVTVGVVVGLVVGKAVGISAFSWLAIRTGVGVLPSETRFGQLVGVALLGGIGFTVSIFVAGLAFAEGPLTEAAKVGVLGASVISAVVGSLVLVAVARRSDQTRPTSGGISVGV